MPVYRFRLKGPKKSKIEDLAGRSVNSIVVSSADFTIDIDAPSSDDLPYITEAAADDNYEYVGEVT